MKAKGRRRRAPWWRRLGRRLIRRVTRRIRLLAGRVVAAVRQETVVRNWNRDAWMREYPDPVHPPLVMRPVEGEQYEAIFDDLVVVPFEIESHSGVRLVDAAWSAGEDEHGPIVRTWSLTEVEACNDAARAILPRPMRP